MRVLLSPDQRFLLPTLADTAVDPVEQEKHSNATAMIAFTRNLSSGSGSETAVLPHGFVRIRFFGFLANAACLPSNG